MLAVQDDLPMYRTIKNVCMAAAAAAALCGSGIARSADTADADQANAKLAAVRARIAALTSRLGAELKQRDALNARLREVEMDITTTQRRLETLHAAQLAAERHRADLRAEQARNESTLQAQRAALGAQVRAAYMIGRQEEIKLLLSQGDPASAGRMSTLYGYFARARALKIDAIREEVAHAREVVAQIDQTTANLKTLETEAARKIADMEHARSARAAALAAIAMDVSSGNRQLAQLRLEEQAVENLVADLARVLQDFPVDTQQSFQALRGRLPWPVHGRMTVRYQEQRGGPAPGLKWNGVLIEAAHGAKVRSPYFGRVVYADWLQGLGLLLIIGHSGNYMTLYGHAEILYKSVGDWVAPGDLIAALSDSGNAAPQLYFEIREGRKAVDPRIWLKASP
jgi:septal ring factor EnvC (AmiA/AmiB activator)